MLSICKALGATNYLSGPRGRDYINQELFHESGVNISFANYNELLEYPQVHGGFVGNVSVLDLIFNVTEDIGKFIKIGEQK